MDDYNRENSGYTPNFVMREPDAAEQTACGAPQGSADKSENTSGAGNAADSAHTVNSGSCGYTGNAAGTDNTQAFYTNTRVNDPRDNFRAGDSCSWNSKEGLGKVKRPYTSHRRRKSGKMSQPVVFTRKTLALLIALCVVLSGAFGIGGAALGNALFENEPAQTAKSNSVKSAGYRLEDATGSNMTVQEITAAAKASVVEIKTESAASDSWMQQYVTKGAGSGVIISDNGYIVTNNHVVDGANKITVTTSGEKEYSAEIVGTDSTSDVAVIKIKASGLIPASYGNSDQIEVGDLAVAIGNPLGELGGTVTAGIISALDRELSIDGKTMTLLQTDSSINPGNSGGGLFNQDGQLIGIVVAKSSGSDVEGLGFAIPINKAAEVAQQLIDNGYVKGQPFTGMTYTEGSQSGGLEAFFGSGGQPNVYIYSVDTNRAKLAGFRPGDMVFAIDGKQITSFDDLSSVVTSHKVGDTLTFTIVRDGQTKDIRLKLEEKKGN